MKYTVIDNKGFPHELVANSDEHALSIMEKRFIDYIVSFLSSNPVVVVRPNGYILAYIKTSSGEQTVKSMSDWGVIE